MFSYYKYSFGGLAIDDVTAIRGACPSSSTDAACPYYYGSDALQIFYGLGGSENKWIAWVCQVAFLIAFTLAGAVVYQFIDWSVPDISESRRFLENDDHNVDIDADQQQKSLDVLPDGAVV
jgi:hypothetical protein